MDLWVIHPKSNQSSFEQNEMLEAIPKLSLQYHQVLSANIEHRYHNHFTKETVVTLSLFEGNTRQTVLPSLFLHISFRRACGPEKKKNCPQK